MKNKINKNKEIKQDINMDIEMAFMCQIPTSQTTRKATLSPGWVIF
jgi:hypothetical protein